MEYNIDTLIIGAGLAGITAARTIEEHNKNSQKPVSYAVLEAADKIGGRVQSEVVHTSDGQHIIINPGAQWLHRDVRMGAPENPLLPHVLESDKLVRDSMPREFWVDGKRVAWNKKIALINKARKLIDNYNGPDIDLASFFDSQHLEESSALRTTFGEVETGAPLNKVSTHDVRELVACNMGDFTSRGLTPFIENYAQGIKENIKLNQKVKKIHYKSDGVDITLSNGDVYHAKQCVLTTSIGVLRSNAIDFEPPLPEAHQEALSHITMGNFNKIFLMFDRNFKFPVNRNTHLDVHTKGGKDFFYLANDNGQKLISTFVGGDLAKLCDSDPKAACDLAIQGLDEIWPDLHIRNHIIQTHTTQWGNNLNVRGGYSRVDIGHHAVREKLAKPIDDVLHLAGEGIGAKHPQTGRIWSTHMPGAAISGERAATEALQVLGVEPAAAKGEFALPVKGMHTGQQATRTAFSASTAR